MLWTIWDFPGFRWIWERFFPPVKTDQKSPSTGLLWLVGVYTALYGIASTRYENQADRIELRANAIISQMGDLVSRPHAFRQICKVQRMKLSLEPDFFAPTQTLGSFFGKESFYGPGIVHLREAVVTWKDELRKPDLSGADLSGADLRGAGLLKADLRGVNLTGTDLSGADLSGVNNWKEANWKDTNIYIVRNEPLGFKDYVLAHGGIEKAPEPKDPNGN